MFMGVQRTVLLPTHPRVGENLLHNTQHPKEADGVVLKLSHHCLPPEVSTASRRTTRKRDYDYVA